MLSCMKGNLIGTHLVKFCYFSDLVERKRRREVMKKRKGEEEVERETKAIPPFM